ncbi:mucin-2 [Puntigrus tetrazona]|uniref:mucin-2 n=1 Tax=Puntigrus tetrazona TaxID=1606681 RepID=UPI001C89F2BD|nr:mucin-2 [Puntigrus tetrazona]
MEMTLLSITVWFTQFLIIPALYFNTLPTNTTSDYTETTQITPATTKTNPQPTVPIYTTSFSLLTASTTQDTITNLPSEVQTQPNITADATATQETASLHQPTSSTPSQNVTMDDIESVNNASNMAMSDANTSHTTVPTNFARLSPRKDDSNETGTSPGVSYNSVQSTVNTLSDTLLDPVDGVSTVPWKYSTEKEDERTKVDEGNYETNSTQATFANTRESRETRGTEGSYTSSSEQRQEHYDTAANTVDVRDATVSNKWSTSQDTDSPMTTAAQGYATVTEYHTSTGGVNHSTTQENINSFTNYTATTGRENRTGTDTPGGTNISIVTDISLNITNNSTNKTDTENKVWPSCLDTKPSRQSMLVCFLTLWTLAMTATIFLGISIFLWVRLSVSKKKMKRRAKGGQASERASLWADPKASVQDRVEFWYINGSTLEADRKEKNSRRMKRRGREQDNEENSLWIQPRVTVDDITEFWYANRRVKQERTEDT